MRTTGARVRDDVARLAHRGLSVAGLAKAVDVALLAAVPAEGTCLMTVDPATMLPTAEFVGNGLPAPQLLRLVEIELREPDYNKWVHLARSSGPAASLSAVTAGDLDRSLRQREIRRPGGFGDELRVVLGDGTATWGELTVFRGADRPWFSAEEVDLVASVAGSLADGLRRGLLLDDVRSGADDVGLLVLDPDDGVVMANPAADRWLAGLGPGDRAGARLPVVVPAVARQARALSAAPDPGDVRPARARVLTRSGQWLTVRGSVMGDRPDAVVTVVLEAARPAEMAPLMVAAYGFTAGERRVTELVALGLSTRRIADRLHLSAYTVQDNLKSIFAKSGTGSRGELVARLFLDHHAARLTGPPGPATAPRAPGR
jgi:DNA-binding CsgD family transcriptional regulator